MTLNSCMPATPMIEAAEDDVAQAQTTQDIVSQLSRYFYGYDQHEPDYGMHQAYLNFGDLSGTYWLLLAETVGIAIPGLLFLFGKRTGIHPTGMNAKTKRPIMGCDRLIFVWCTRSADDAGEVAKAVTYNVAVHHVIQHEMIHLLDRNRRKSPQTRPERFQNDPQSYPDEYYNSAGEFNAYFHNLVERLTRMIRQMRDEPESAEDIAFLYDYNPDFMTMLKSTMTSSRFFGLRGFLRHLNPERKRRAIKRIYALHQYAGKLLNDATQ